jgi:methyltransferase-like protein 6
MGEKINEFSSTTDKILSQEDIEKLEKQNSRLVSQFQAQKLEKEALKNWDLFYKRNETRFFKDRNWTTREFDELLSEPETTQNSEHLRKLMLEVGCGVGNLIFPLIQDQKNNYFIYACDFSPRAIEMVRQNELYDECNMKAFQCDITTDQIFEHIEKESLDIITMIFVLSAIHPEKFSIVVKNLYRILKPNGVLLFRDYGLYDMAQLRFKPGNKIAENFYVRQDGTRSYYFSVNEIHKLFDENGFDVITNSYIHRRTINKKENIDVPRIFVQGKFKKPKF